MNHILAKRIHPIAGVIALLTITIFWSASFYSLFSHDPDIILCIKTRILYGLGILIPALAIVGGSGFKLGGKSKHHVIQAKKKRMPFIAANGILVLVPSAVFLYWKAAQGDYTGLYYPVQALELLAGAVNISLLGLSMRDGLRLSKRFAASKNDMKPSI